MSDLGPASEWDMQQISAAWLASATAGGDLDDRVACWLDKWLMAGDYMAIWRLMLMLCRDVASDDSDTIEMIGHDLSRMIEEWPDPALALIEAEVAGNPTLFKALLNVSRGGKVTADRIDAILIRHVEQVSASWLASQAAGDSPEGWVESWQSRWYRPDDYMAMWRFVLKLCEDVASDDSKAISMIGVDPLNSMMIRWEDETLMLIEAEVASNPTLLKATSILLTTSDAVEDRLDAILARYGETRGDS
jgi:hypothetical protein